MQLQLSRQRATPSTVEFCIGLTIRESQELFSRTVEQLELIAEGKWLSLLLDDTLNLPVHISLFVSSEVVYELQVR